MTAIFELPGAWITNTEADGLNHFVPNGDEALHAPNAGCWCNPQMLGPAVIHRKTEGTIQ